MRSHLLLTGGTGSIGRRWLPLLLAADPQRNVTVLVRAAASVPAHPRVAIIRGDLREPVLGFGVDTWRSLAGSLTDIVHCGADVRFTRTLEEARAVNTQGTESLLALARECERLRRFAHISTAYVMGRDEGILPEREYVNSSGFVNTYQQSKYEAELAVFAAMPQVPAAVFRLSSVIGRHPNYFHQALRFIPRNPFPVIPAALSCRMDFISERWAAAALSGLFERHFIRNAVFHVCAGAEGSVPVETLLNLASKRFGQTRLPAFVSLAEFERFADATVRRGGREAVRELLRSALSFLPHLALSQTFQNSATDALLRAEGLDRPDGLTLLREVLAHVSGEEPLAGMPVPAREPVWRNAQPVEDLQRGP